MMKPLPAFLAAVSLALIPAGALFAQEAVSPPPVVEGADAPSPVSKVEGAEREALLDVIATALSGVETAKGRFRQYNADYTETSGDFFIRRPGRVRFDYDDPSPFLIVADGTTVAIEDSDLETQDRVPLRRTPLAAILDDKIDLNEKVNILDVSRTSDFIVVTSEDKSGEIEGRLSMIFDATDYSLMQWQTIDANGATTRVELSAIETDVSLNPRLFRIEELDEGDERD